MPVPKKYIHDRTVLLLLSFNAFLTIITSLLITLRLGPGRGGSYIIEYRSNLGLNEFKGGSTADIMSFVAYVVFIFAFHTFLSARVYHIRRHLAIAILGMGLLLLTVALIVSNALLML
jgi:hypothetical protein